MPSSNSKSVRNALKTIANADTTLRTLCGRTTNLMVTWKSALTAAKPILAVMIAANNRIGGDGDKRKVLALIGAFAEGTGAQGLADDLIQRCREIYTPAAFQGQGLDAAVVWSEASDRETDDDLTTTTATNLARVDLDLPIIVNAAQ